MELKAIEEALWFVAQQGWNADGGGFHTAMVRYLGEALAVDYVIVDQLGDEPGTAETVAVYSKGEIVPNFRYSLAGTPCENILDRGLCCFASKVREMFPDDALLVQMNVDSYIGIPLWDSGGKVLGLIAAMDSRSMEDRTGIALKLLQIMATRAAAELERERTRIDLERHYARQLRLEQQIQEARKLESLRRLAGGIAHDFNNILGAMMGFGRFVVEDLPANHPSRKYAERIVSAGQRGKDLVDRILVFARQQETTKTLFCLADLIKDIYPMLEVAIPSSIQIMTKFDPRRVTVEADRFQLGQVLMNLCLNSRDAMEGLPGLIIVVEGVMDARDAALARAAGAINKPHVEHECDDLHVPHAGKVGAATTWTEDDGTFRLVVGTYDNTRSYAFLAVQDHGTGIDQSVLSKIFDPFFTTKEIGKGTGLGLSVVHGAIMDHGGLIAVRSKPNCETEFRIVLPIADNAEQQPVSTPTYAPSFARTKPSGKVLLVDDDFDTGEMLSFLLRRSGWDVSHHLDSVTAFMEFQASPDDWSVVVTDQVMPGLRGQDLIAKIREIRMLPCILCTGYDPPISQEEAARLGIIAILSKPLFSDELIVIIEQALCATSPVTT